MLRISITIAFICATIAVTTDCGANGETYSPNMSLPLATQGVTTAPAWASDINASFDIIDGHNHCSGSGVQIHPCGLNISSDLSFLGNNATNLNQAIFQTNVGTPSNLGIYTNGTDLYYKDSSGTAIQITKSGGVNVSAGNIQNLPSTPTGGAGISWQNSQGTFQLFKDSGSVGANLDGGTLVVRYPGSYPAPSGNYVAIQAPSGLSSGYALTLPSIPGSQSFMTLDSSGNIAAPWTVDNSTIQISSNQLQVKPNGVPSVAKNATSSSQDLVVSANPSSNALMIVRGTVNGTNDNIIVGEGFTVSGSVGQYAITFSTAFAETPTVTCSLSVDEGTCNVANAQSSSAIHITTLGWNGSTLSVGNHSFSFIAIGQRQ